ncbi:MAG: glycosyltransferase family 2 protein [Pseudomonadota bacterium]
MLDGGAQRDRRSVHIKAAICVLTRQRPDMLQRALDSIQQMRVPENASIFVVVVENDVLDSAIGLASALQKRSGIATIYERETRIGIPYARNRALSVALAQGADVILFFDDDEVVTEDWLDGMLIRYRETDLDLIGGPVVMDAEVEPRGWITRSILFGTNQRFHSRISRAEKRLARGDEGRIPISTNNWLASRAVFEAFGIYFDESYGAGAGSDMKFYRDASRAGVKTGWAANAFVKELVPIERLTIGYVFKRTRDQRSISIYRDVQKSGYWRTIIRSAPELFYRCVAIPFGPLVVVLSGGRALAGYVRFIGKAAGIITGLLGHATSHYQQTTGH